MAMTNPTTTHTMSAQPAIQLAGTLTGSTVQLSVNGAPISGTVSSAGLQNGAVYVTVNGNQYPVSDLVSITQTPAQSAAAPPAAAAAAATSGATTPASN